MQVKKDAVRDKIRTATMRLLERNRYLDTTIPKIAKKANVSPANIYRYYSSKFELFYDVLDPWLNAKFDAFKEQAIDVSDPKERFELTLRFMWIDLPKADNCFLINLIEALASKREKDRYSRDLLLALERRIEKILESCLGENSSAHPGLADATHLIFMAHDGFVLNTRLAEDHLRIERLISLLSDLFAARFGTIDSGANTDPGDFTSK